MCFHTLFAGAGQLFSALCCASIFFYIYRLIKDTFLHNTLSDELSYPFPCHQLLCLLFKMVIIKKSGSICNICFIRHKAWSWNPSGSDVTLLFFVLQSIYSDINGHFKEFICLIKLSISLWFLAVNYFLLSSAACDVGSDSRSWRSVITASSWWIVPTINQLHAKLAAILCACL